MKTCDDCKHAEWERTAAGRLHPKKEGRCVFPWELPPIPQAFRWVGGDPEQMLVRGPITRGREFNKHCAYWARKEAGHG